MSSFGHQREQHSEFHDKVVVEEAIENGVGDGGGHPHHVADHVGEHHALWNISIIFDSCVFSHRYLKISETSTDLNLGYLKYPYNLPCLKDVFSSKK